MTTDLAKKVNLDNIFIKFCPSGKYHRCLYMWALIYSFCNALNANHEFVAKKESFFCVDPDFDGDVCNVNVTHRCNKFVYDNPDSFVAVYDLGCNEWKRSLVSIVYSLGQIVCLLLTGPLSDILGRKTVIVATVVWGGVFNLAKSFSPTYWIYIALEFIGAAFGNGFMPLLTLCIELSASKHRVFFVSMIFTCPATGGILLPLMAWFFPNFKVFLRVISAPAILCCFYYYVIDESPRWLVNRGRVEEAVAIVEHIGEVNHVAVDINPIQDYQNDKNEKSSYLSTMRLACTTKTMIIRFVLCSILCLTYLYSIWDLLDDSILIDGSKYVNYALVNALNIPGAVIGAFLTNNQRRKLNFYAVLIPATIVCWTHVFLPQNIKTSVVIYIVGMIVDSFLSLFIIIVIAEVFPTKTRMTALGFCHAIGCFGKVAAHQTLLLAKYWFALPQMLFGLSMFIAFLVTLILPETYRDLLPESVEDAKCLGTQNGFKAIFKPKKIKKEVQDCCG